ncbi:hypothetical protein C5167_023535 [Papaver somniferum]|uniref:Cyclin N-terminal domain-containing protein n=1 Tax=Papaver somniferum TaxID=3469 RepID=A0A4Y7JP76_PAPSO|nr:hypothetical protein C5167_023535 [Papaver somniferum]
MNAGLRRSAVEFLIVSSLQLGVTPVVKYTALSIFVERFLPSIKNNNSPTRTNRIDLEVIQDEILNMSAVYGPIPNGYDILAFYAWLGFLSTKLCGGVISRSLRKKHGDNWLLQPLRQCNLQLLALVSVWVSSKIHDTRPLSVQSLKSLGDVAIKEQHYTTRDFLEAEVVLLQVLDFEIGASNVAYVFLEDFLIRLRKLARVGDLVKLEACMDIMDVLYETEETSVLYNSPDFLAAAILACLFVILAINTPFSAIVPHVPLCGFG